MLDQLLEEIQYALSMKWVNYNLDIKYTAKFLKELKKDYEYLLRVKEMDKEIDELRKENPGQVKKKLEMTDVVPVAGLIMARFHIYECECNTALEMWKQVHSTTPNTGAIFSDLLSVRERAHSSLYHPETFRISLKRAISDHV